MREIIKISTKDNVMIALKDLKKGKIIKVENEKIQLKEDILQGHKFAIQEVHKGQEVIKYGYEIGYAIKNIEKGEWVHTHNIKTQLGEILEYTYKPSKKSLEPREDVYFEGYRRKNGQVGIRNEIWIIPTVGCVNSIGEQIIKEASCYIDKNEDLLHTLSHPYGCSQMGEDHENTQKALVGLVNHPNAGAILVLGLGCENNNISEFKKKLGEYDEERVRFLECQAYEDEVLEGVKIIKELIKYTQKFQRESVHVKELVIGLKCGGSDGMSGITANPLVGKFSDFLIARGGSTILTEVPEMFGAETILMDRCKDIKTFEDTVNLINGFKKYFIKHHQVVYENPSPGNKKGGISTLEDKSLGCIQKGGTAEVVDVLKYGEAIKEKGLNLLESPGNDLVASTALAVSGAHIVLFTTGRGTPFGAPVPTVKISSNSELYNKKRGWIDFDAGEITNGKAIEILANEFFEYILEVASGRRTLAEKKQCKDLAIFKNGVTL